MKLYLNRIRDLPFIVKFFLLTEFLLYISYAITGMEINYSLSAKGFSSDKIGELVSFGTLAAAGFSLFGGFFSRKIGYKGSLTLGCFIKAAATVLLVYSDGFALITVSRILNGLSDSLICVAVFPYITSFVRGQSLRAMVYTLVFCCQTTAQFAGTMFAGSFYSILPSYNGILLIGAVTVGLAAGLRLFLPRTEEVIPVRKENARGLRKWVYIPRQRHVIAYYLYDFFGYAAYMVSYGMVTLILRDSFGATDGTVGVVLSAVTLSAAVLFFLTPFIATRWNRFRLNAIVLFAVAAIYPFMAFLKPAPNTAVPFAILFVVVTVIQYLISGLIDGPMLETIPENEKGSFSGIKLLVNYLGLGVGSFVAGSLYFAFPGYTAIYLVAGGLILVQVAIYLLGLKRTLDQRTGNETSEVKM